MSQMFTKAPPATPMVQPPATMPDSESSTVREAKRKSQLDIMSRAGRSSTILTAPERLSGDYSAVKTGASA